MGGGGFSETLLAMVRVCSCKLSAIEANDAGSVVDAASFDNLCLLFPITKIKNVVSKIQRIYIGYLSR